MPDRTLADIAMSQHRAAKQRAARSSAPQPGTKQYLADDDATGALSAVQAILLAVALSLPAWALFGLAVWLAWLVL